MPLPFQTVVHVASAAFAAIDAPNVTIPFTPKEIAVAVLDSTAANYVEVSFDGTHVHGKFVPGALGGFDYVPGIENTAGADYSKLWIRGPNAVDVEIIALAQ